MRCGHPAVVTAIKVLCQGLGLCALRSRFYGDCIFFFFIFILYKTVWEDAPPRASETNEKRANTRKIENKTKQNCMDVDVGYSKSD